MKNKINTFAIIALVVIIGFAVTTCGDDNNDETTTCTHDWIWTLNTTPATCTTASKDTATCKNAGCKEINERTGSIAALGHEGVGAVQPTCQTEGNTGTGTCTSCLQTVTGQTIPVDPNAHDWEWTEDAVLPTCEAAGKDIATCKHNGCEETDERTGSDALGHDWNITSGTAPTCTTPGNGTGNCKRCPETVTDGVIPIDSNAHSVNWGSPFGIEETCTTQGGWGYLCNHNPEHQIFWEIFPALGHNIQLTTIVQFKGETRTEICLNGCKDAETQFTPFYFKAISAGSNFPYTLAIRTDGTLWACGENTFGQLGDGTNTRRLSLVQIGSDANWASVFAGYNHSLAIRTDDSLWAWGDNAGGKLGDGTNTRRHSPVEVAFGIASVSPGIGIASVSAGNIHSVAISTNSRLLVWGRLTYFNQDNDFSYSPTLANSGYDWASVSAGFEHNVAIKTNGTLWAWGRNNYGKLGDGTTTDRHSLVQIGSDSNWASVSAGYEYTVAIKIDGTLWAWGRNSFGQLGDSTTIDRHSPVQIGSDSNWTSVSAGDTHTLAIKTDSTLWAWGNNFSGQLGDGTTNNRLSPAQ